MTYTIKLNCSNLFSFFVFHPKDERLSQKDQKIAKVIAILLKCTLIGRPICRLFYNKKMVQIAKTKTSDLVQNQILKSQDKEQKRKESSNHVLQDSFKLNRSVETSLPLIREDHESKDEGILKELLAAEISSASDDKGPITSYLTHEIAVEDQSTKDGKTLKDLLDSEGLSTSDEEKEPTASAFTQQIAVEDQSSKDGKTHNDLLDNEGLSTSDEEKEPATSAFTQQIAVKDQSAKEEKTLKDSLDSEDSSASDEEKEPTTSAFTQQIAVEDQSAKEEKTLKDSLDSEDSSASDEEKEPTTSAFTQQIAVEDQSAKEEKTLKDSLDNKDQLHAEEDKEQTAQFTSLAISSEDPLAENNDKDSTITVIQIAVAHEDQAVKDEELQKDSFLPQVSEDRSVKNEELLKDSLSSENDSTSEEDKKAVALKASFGDESSSDESSSHSEDLVHFTVSSPKSTFEPLSPIMSPKIGDRTRTGCRFVLKSLLDSPISASLPSFDFEEACTTIKEEKISASLNWLGQRYFPDIRLLNWPFLRNDKLSVIGKDLETIEELDNLIDRRIDELNKVVKFEERIAGLEKRDHLKLLTMKDLELNLYDSGILAAIASPEELAQFEITQVSNQNQLTIIKQRMSEIAKTIVTDLPKDLSRLTLQQVCSLSGNQLDQIINELPSSICYLLSDEQIKEMNFTNLKSSAAFKELFPTEGKFERAELFAVLDIRQLYQCWDFLDLKHFSYFSQKQISQLSPKPEKKMDLSIFQALFPKGKRSNIQHLKPTMIIFYWSLFDAKKIKYLSVSQVNSLNFDLFNSRKDLFYALFDVKKDRTKELCSHVSQTQMKMLDPALFDSEDGKKLLEMLPKIAKEAPVEKQNKIGRLNKLRKKIRKGK